MSYIFNELLVCLLLAAVIGGIIGWLLRHFMCKAQHADYDDLKSSLADRDRKIGEADAALRKREGEYNDLASRNAQATAALADATAVKAENLRDMPVEEIEGIGPAIGRQLREAGVPTVFQLLEKGLTPEGRQAMHSAVVASKNLSKVELSVVNNWVSMADLLRVPGVGKQNAELMVASRVNSVGELQKQGAGALSSEMKKVNERDHITTDKVPGEQEVAAMIKAANSIDVQLKDL